MPNAEPFWGEIHTHTALSDGNGEPEDHFEIAKSHLDFWAMADHAYDEVVFDYDYRKLKPGRQILNDHWEEIQDLCRQHEAPGSFIPILAYEWTNFRFGHHNVYYLDYDQPIRMPPTLPELYASLDGIDAFVIPHHTAYPVGVCGKDWDVHDDALTPFVELYSMHGSSEEPGDLVPLVRPGSWMGPGASGGSVQEALARGCRLGIMASSDSHEDHPGAYDNGLIAAVVPQLTRASLWDAFRERRIYGVTGDRIELDFSIDGLPMGSVIRGGEVRRIAVKVSAWDAVERIDLIRNNELVESFIEPRGADDDDARRVRFRFMVEWGWDRLGARDWTGALRLADGRIRRAVLCYRGSVASRIGRGITHRDDATCRWTSTTEKPATNKLTRRSADMIAFEVECGRDAPLTLELACDGLRREIALTADEIMHDATVAYMENIPPTNDGAYWHGMTSYAKVKIHRGRRTAALTLDIEHEDHRSVSTGSGTDFYYVRVIQKNGQRAWSSPIWVEH